MSFFYLILLNFYPDGMSSCHQCNCFLSANSFMTSIQLAMKILATPAKKDLFLNFYLDEEFLSFFSSKPFRSFLHVYPTIYFDIDHNKKMV